MYAVRRKRCAASAGISASVRRRTVPDTSSGRLQSSLVSGGANRARTRVVRVGSSAVPTPVRASVSDGGPPVGPRSSLIEKLSGLY